MTTKKFSGVSLPFPKSSIELDFFDLRPKDGEIQLPKLVPKFCDIVQVIEVRKPGMYSSSNLDKCIEQSLGSCVLIENVRPELFVRRDFISKFVHNGTVHLVQVTSKTPEDCGYGISTKDNVMIISMNEKQYRRFGLIAKKCLKHRSTGEKFYKIEIDLNDIRIMKSNKFQDSLVKTLRRLNIINKVYFRFAPSESNGAELKGDSATDMSLEFLRYVIHEYEMDGMKPVPLSGCSKIRQRIERRWRNNSQLHPELNNSCEIENLENSELELAIIVDLVEWLGFQLLSIDCEEALRSTRLGRYKDDNGCDRCDVECRQICGPMDFDVMKNIFLKKLFKLSCEEILLRATFLYLPPVCGDTQANDGVHCVVLLQNCLGRSDSITVIGLRL